MFKFLTWNKEKIKTKEEQCVELIGKTLKKEGKNPFSDDNILILRVLDVKNNYVKYDYNFPNIDKDRRVEDSYKCSELIACIKNGNFIEYDNIKENIKVFLGGTCNESTWRTSLIEKLKCEYFNPVVDNWTPECQAEEEKQKEECDFNLFVITPKMAGVFSIAEVVDLSNKRPRSTLFCLLDTDEDCRFTKAQLKSLKAVENLLKNNGVECFDDIDNVAEYLNKF